MPSAEAALGFLEKAVAAAGYRLGDDVVLAPALAEVVAALGSLGEGADVLAAAHHRGRGAVVGSIGAVGGIAGAPVVTGGGLCVGDLVRSGT